MKIGFDAKRAFHNQTGLGNYSRSLVASFMKQFPDNEYFLFDTGMPLSLPYFERSLNESGAAWHRVETSNIGRVYGWGGKVGKLNLDVFHGLSNEIPLDWKPGKVRSVVTIHDLIFKRFPQTYTSTDRWIYEKKTAFAAKNADVILAASHQTREDLERFFPSSAGKTHVLYQDAEPTFQTRKRPEAVARTLHRYNLIEEPYFLCVSKLEQRKNHLTLIKAFSQIKERVPHSLVLVGGPGDTARDVEKEMDQMPGRLRWLRGIDQDELLNLYDGSEFCVYPSVFEGFGIPLVEAMRRGKALITSTGSCFKEIAGQAALYADPESSDEFATILLDLCLNPSHRDQLATHAQNELKRYDRSNLNNELMTFYR